MLAPIARDQSVVSVQIEERNVVLGLQTAAQFEIVSGLQLNDLVLFGGMGQYKPGQVVSPKIVEPPSLE